MHYTTLNLDFKTKNVLFLDHDGVLHTGNDYCYKKENYFKSLNGILHCDPFSKKAVKVLNRIIEKTNSEIIISSDWRHYFTLDQMAEIYKAFGIIKSPVGYTLVHHNEEESYHILRSNEILEWVNIYEPYNWVAIDDLPLILNHNNFVYCPRFEEGIKQSGIEQKIISRLKY